MSLPRGRGGSQPSRGDKFGADWKTQDKQMRWWRGPLAGRQLSQAQRVEVTTPGPLGQGHSGLATRWQGQAEPAPRHREAHGGPWAGGAQGGRGRGAAPGSGQGGRPQLHPGNLTFPKEKNDTVSQQS